MRQPQTAYNSPIHLDESKSFEALGKIIQLDDLGFLIIGRSIDYNAIDGDSAFVAKFNQYGTLQWQNRVAALTEGITAAGHFAED